MWIHFSSIIMFMHSKTAYGLLNFIVSFTNMQLGNIGIGMSVNETTNQNRILWRSVFSQNENKCFHFYYWKSFADLPLLTVNSLVWWCGSLCIFYTYYILLLRVFISNDCHMNMDMPFKFDFILFVCFVSEKNEYQRMKNAFQFDFFFVLLSLFHFICPIQCQSLWSSSPCLVLCFITTR